MKWKLLAGKMILGILCFFIAIFLTDMYIMEYVVHSGEKIEKEEKKIEVATILVDAGIEQDAPLSKYQYKEIDREKLKQWLWQKDSLLAEDAYFDAIIHWSAEYDIHPFLLFAITGQEQNFVPKSHPDALQIGNNPFNVYGSWKKYNTTIGDSSKIVVKTIKRLSQNCPEDENYFQWINSGGSSGGGYAADSSWHEGVSYFFESMCEEVGEL